MLAPCEVAGRLVASGAKLTRKSRSYVWFENTRFYYELEVAVYSATGTYPRLSAILGSQIASCNENSNLKQGTTTKYRYTVATEGKRSLASFGIANSDVFQYVYRQERALYKGAVAVDQGVQQAEVFLVKTGTSILLVTASGGTGSDFAAKAPLLNALATVAYKSLK